MTVKDAVRNLKDLDDHKPFKDTSGYYKVVASIIKIHTQALSKPALGVLKNIASPATFQYLQNNSRYLRLTQGRDDIPDGTPVNEAEHAIMKTWFSNVIEQSRARLWVSLRLFVAARKRRWALHSAFRLSVGRKQSEANYRRMLAIIAGAVRNDPGLFQSPKKALKRPASATTGARKTGNYEGSV